MRAADAKGLLEQRTSCLATSAVPLTGAVHLAGPVSVFRSTTSEFDALHSSKRR